MVTRDGFFSYLLKLLDLFFCCGYGGVREDVRKGAWFISHH
jgi:hypothetical protein